MPPIDTMQALLSFREGFLYGSLGTYTCPPEDFLRAGLEMLNGSLDAGVPDIEYSTIPETYTVGLEMLESALFGGLVGYVIPPESIRTGLVMLEGSLDEG